MTGNPERRRQRMRQTAEHFTPSWLVNDMLDKLSGTAWTSGKTFVDPACGNGNMLVCVLQRKIANGHAPLQALQSVFGTDIMPDNVEECRLRLLKSASRHAAINEDMVSAVFTNIVCTPKSRFANGSLDYDFGFPQTTETAMVKKWTKNIEELLKRVDDEGLVEPRGSSDNMRGTRILEGDALDVLKTLPSGLANSLVTSPPYYLLRDYGVAGQIGLEESVEQYVEKLVEVFREARRVLRDDGTLWLNLGDSYSNGKMKSLDELRACAVRSNAPNRRRASSPRNLLGIPWRIALALQADGWVLRSEIIWHKPAVIPLGGQRRPVVSHETVFMLAKDNGYYYGRDDIRERTGNEMSWAEYEARRGKSWRGSAARKDDAQMGRCRMNQKPKPGTHPLGRDCRSVWKIPAQHRAKGGNGEHYATFPPALAERMILAGCPKGGVVLDPFMGSGTTAFAAKKLGRHCIGIELNPQYAQMSRERLAACA